MINVPVSVLDLATVVTGQSTSDAFAGSIELAKAADKLGANRFWVAEHHNMASVAATSPPVLVAAIAGVTERIRVGSGGVMLPNHSPYVVAEQFAALEALYPGRIDLGIGRAPGADPITAWALRRSQEGLDVHEFPEHVGLVRAWLSPRGVSTGRGGTLVATPAASSYPEMWLLGSSDYSAALAGKLGMAYSYAAHFGQLDPAEVMNLYRSEFRPSPTLAEPYAMLATSAIVGATHDEAMWHAGPSTVNWLNLRRDTRGPLPTPAEAAERLADLDLGGFCGTKVVGTADEVTERLNALVAETGVQELMVLTVTADVQTRVDTLAALLS